MQFLAITFPAIRSRRHLVRTARDPLVCAGLYQRHRARMDICPLADQERKLWGGPAPIALRATRRLHPLGHHRHHRRRPHRIRAVLQSRLLHPAPGRDFPIVEGRHVVSRRLPRLRRRGDAVCAARTSISILSLGDITTAVGADRNVPRAACQLHQQRVVGPEADASVPWAMVFPEWRPAAPPSKPALRSRRSRASCCLRSWRS